MQQYVTNGVVDGGQVIGTNDAVSVVVDHRERLHRITSHTS